MNAGTGTDPVFSADFAERVLARADGLIARNRRVRRVTGGGAALCVVSAAVVSWVVMSRASQSPPQRPASQSVAVSDTTVEAQADETDALSDLFPDAASVARFATEYSTTTGESDTALLSDEDASS